jgi:hypothetical protein
VVLKVLVNFLFFTCFALISLPGFCGSREGFFVLVVDLNAGKLPVSRNLVNEYFGGRFPQALYSCDDGRVAKFELVYLRKRPKAISEKIIKSAVVGNKSALARVRRIIGEYKDKDLNDGFDFLVAYELIDNVLEISAISSANGIPSVRESLMMGSDFRSSTLQKDFSGAICALVGSMPYVVAP